MKNDNETVVSDHFQRPRKVKSRQVSSRFLSPASATVTAVPPSSPNQALSPTHRKTRSSSFEPRKQRSQERSIFAHGLWPSSTTSSSKRFDTLAHHLGNERLNDENDKPIIGDSGKIQGKYVSSSKLSVQSSESARLSVDENALFGRSFRRNNFDVDSDYSDIESPMMRMICKSKTHRKSGIIIPSKYMKDVQQKRPQRGSSESSLPNPNPVSLDGSPTTKKASSKNPFQRSNSISGHGSSSSQWALSPGRSGSPPMSVESKEKLMSFSSLRPVITPPRGATGMEKLLNLGLDFFKSRKASISTTSPIGHKVSDNVHQLRLFHNRLVQWRFANAKAQSASGNLTDLAEKHLANAWYDIAKLQLSVQQKKLQLQKEKLQFKLNFILISQLKALESWVGMERQHLTALSITKDCLHSVICRVPLIEGAKIDAQAISMAFRQASDLAISIESMMNIYASRAKETAFLLSELAKVVIQERLILEEVFELHKIISALEMEEISLKCAIVQMKARQQHQQQQLRQQNEETSVT